MRVRLNECVCLMMVKYVFDEMNAGIWRIGYVYLVMWKHVFDELGTRIW